MASKLSSGIRSVSLSSDIVPDYSVIAAIDFGTSSSGYAFVFRKTVSDEIELSDIQLNKWQLGSASSSTDKTPTTVLLKPNKKFNSFGYKAEDKYAKLCDARKQKGWWYFQKFKMMLYKTKLSRRALLEDAEGKPMSAKYVFSVVIGHLKDCILEDVSKQNPGIKEGDILYVLTVPAIWSDAAKQFMREAATDPTVGITDSQLKLVLEPEAASLFCRNTTSRVVRESTGNTKLDALEIGHKYILLDLGGGTADIATHEIIENGNLHEIDYGRGDNLGGQQFNENFFQFLSDLLGENTFKKWKQSQHGDYNRLQRAIEGIKWEIEGTHDWDDDLILKMPPSLVELVQNDTKKSVGEMLAHSRFASDVKLKQTIKFLLKSEFVKGFFASILTGVLNHMNDICKNASAIETVFIVGGLAKSAYVAEFIKAKFPKYAIIIPEDPNVAVLKGAVMLGNKPNAIAGRIARYSYGIGKAPLFVENEHDEKYMFIRDGTKLCGEVFEKLIEKEAVLKYGDTFTYTGNVDAKMPATKQLHFTTDLYQSTSRSPSYYTEPGCTKLGGLTIYPPAGGWPDHSHIDVQIIVGEAEFRFYATDCTGRKYETTLDFLVQTESN